MNSFMMRKIFVAISLVSLIAFLSVAQEKEQIIRQLYDSALIHQNAYKNLEFLCKKIGHRLSGSPSAEAAVAYTRQLMIDYGFDSVWLQPVVVPRWVRGETCEVFAFSSFSTGLHLTSCALGGSIGTSLSGITATLLEVKSIDELENMSSKAVKGKIVFFNGAFDEKEISTFSAYGRAVAQRWSGAMAAAKLGALGILVRSMSSGVDDIPHTGSMGYDTSITKIPGIAISTRSADILSERLKIEPNLKVTIKADCRILDDVLSNNVVGEIRGKTKSDKIILVGGHLDSWDMAEGAHDDGAGCMQAIESLRLLKAIGYSPNHTLRVTLFMNEENGLKGAKEYSLQSEFDSKKHVFAIESDRGGFAPRGFSFDVKNATEMTQFQGFSKFFEPYQANHFYVGGGGADISPLKTYGTICIGLIPESQRYFKVHHSSADTFETVDARELSLGAAAMASLIYLLDQIQ